jgi:ABC-type nitrate/sulfonate/bicarbonate transport system substrate-binding protein
MASPKIKNPVELKGKVIGVTSPSGGSWMFTTLALEYWGLDAKRDGISFRVLGDESVRSQALLNDTIAATHLGYTSLHRSKTGASPTWLTPPNCLSPFKVRES